MSSIEFQAGVLCLSGELDHVTVSQLRAEAARLLPTVSEPNIQIDCSAVTRSNSAGLALLLAIMRDAKQLNKTVSIEHLPEDLRQMAHVC